LWRFTLIDKSLTAMARNYSVEIPIVNSFGSFRHIFKAIASSDLTEQELVAFSTWIQTIYEERHGPSIESVWTGLVLLYRREIEQQIRLDQRFGVRVVDGNIVLDMALQGRQSVKASLDVRSTQLQSRYIATPDTQ
jgi:hypothetical protein